MGKANHGELESRLELSDQQREKILAEIQATSLEITNNQEIAIEDHYHLILALHDRLIPYLEPDQQEKSKKTETSYSDD